MKRVFFRGILTELEVFKAVLVLFASFCQNTVFQVKSAKLLFLNTLKISVTRQNFRFSDF
jgi:hypothetical protein